MPGILIPTLIGTGILTALCLAAAAHPRSRRILKRGIRTGRTLGKDPRIPRIPRCLRWALLAAFVVPIPGELDEILGILILAAMWPRYGHVIRSTWAATA